MTNDPMNIDYVEIDARARQLRADMLGAALRRGFAWLRNPRGIAVSNHGRTA